MSEIEKQESQKTVVAFITGLLIGGLLVWVFSSTPEQVPAPEAEKETADAPKEVEQETEKVTETAAAPEVAQKIDVKDASIVVTDQKAGKSVMLGALSIPTRSGWVVVRDFMDGTPGNVLGAARFSADEGLMPTRVDLVRETTVGSSYQVVFYTNNGGTEFKLGEDVAIDGVSTTFKAQ